MCARLIHEGPSLERDAVPGWRRELLAAARVLVDIEAIRTWGAPLPPAAAAPEAPGAGPAADRVA